MGQARQRRLAGEMPWQQESKPLDTAKIEMLCEEARATFEDWYVDQYAGELATPQHKSGSCHALSVLTEGILRKAGFDAKATGGFVNWRCGRAAYDTLNHMPPNNNIGLFSANKGLVYGHYWVQIGNTIIDPTTAYFAEKVAFNDAQDGYKTTIEWNVPRTLISSRDDVRRKSKLQSVTNAFEVCYAYEQHSGFDAYLAQCRDALMPMLLKIENPQLITSLIRDDGSVMMI